MQLFENEYVLIELKEDKSLYVKWTDETKKMSSDFFREVNLWYVDYFNKYQIKTFMINSQDFRFAIVPEIQEWVAQEIIAKVVVKGLKKLAFVVSTEMISQLSIEQTMEEDKSDAFSLSYFDNESDADKWLNS